MTKKKIFFSCLKIQFLLLLYVVRCTFHSILNDNDSFLLLGTFGRKSDSAVSVFCVCVCVCGNCKFKFFFFAFYNSNSVVLFVCREKKICMEFFFFIVKKRKNFLFFLRICHLVWFFNGDSEFTINGCSFFVVVVVVRWSLWFGDVMCVCMVLMMMKDAQRKRICFFRIFFYFVLFSFA